MRLRRSALVCVERLWRASLIRLSLVFRCPLGQCPGENIQGFADVVDDQAMSHSQSKWLLAKSQEN